MRPFMKSSLTNPLSHKEFIQFNNQMLFERLTITSYMLILTYPCFFIVDFFLFAKLHHPTYKLMLAAVHLTGLLSALLFLITRQYWRSKAKGFVVISYILLYLLLGAVSSINSQLLNGNIYSYIIIIFSVAVIFPIQPKNLIAIFSSVHVIFVIGLTLMGPSNYTLLLKLINSTGAAVISVTIALAFYRFRQSDFSTKQKLRKSEEGFQRLFHMNPNPLILTNLNFEILLINKRAIEYYQLEGKNTLKKDAAFVFPRQEERLEILTMLGEQKSIHHYIMEQQITSTQRKWSMLHFELVDYLDTTCILIDSTDITDMKEKEQELIKHATIDALTGIRNRRYGLELLRKELSDGPHGRGFILCIIDVNNLKKVNDCYGHSTGDDLIKTCCEIINRQMANHDILFRLGGDEFIVIFYEKQMKDVQLIWETINLEFQKINETSRKPYQISASQGYYHYLPGTPITLEEMLEIADKEMYKNKFQYKAQLKVSGTM